MSKPNVDNVKFYNTKTIVDRNGNLCPLESLSNVPFDIKRVFYVYGVRDEKPRGNHAHYKTQQLLICLSGKVEVVCKDGDRQVRYLLESPQQAVYIPEMIWDEQIYRTDQSVLLVLSNTSYDPSDYIHDFDQFKRLRSEE
jgi:dTDP-4-dehydrorhamnose 3,5-epimerase-like enzyme